jgi:hypothetical protein
MPFDGNFLPESSIAQLISAQRIRMHVEERAAARERYAKARLPTNSRPIPENLRRRTMKARESIVVLDMLERGFGGRENWRRKQLHDSRGGHCLLGMLQHVRAVRGAGDHAGIYLSRAIKRFYSERRTIIDFNDSRSDYAEIRAVIVLARELAQRVVDAA